MAAQEQQHERVVALGNRRRPVGRLVHRRENLAASASVLVPQPIGHPPCRDGDQPAAWALGQAVGRPLRRGREQSLLHGILRVVEVAVPSRDGTEHLRRQLAQQVLDGRHRRPASITGRTWISFPIGLPSGPGAADVLAAISIARCSDSTSTSQ
jgi:hypothetical protein